MCSLTQSDFLPKAETISSGEGRTCIKCKLAPSTVNVHTAFYCDPCFIDQVQHKFRLAMSKHRHGGRIAVGVSGGLSSLCLLHLCRTVSLRNLECCLPLCYDTPPAGLVEQESNLEIILKPDFIPHGKDALVAGLVEKAMSLDCNLLLLGDNCARLATRILTAVCEGRGEQVARMQTPFTRGTLTGLYPLKDLHPSEIAHYAHLHGITRLKPVEEEPVDKERTVASLTEHFLLGLVKEHAATASTVTRTAAKLPVLHDTTEPHTDSPR